MDLEHGVSHHPTSLMKPTFASTLDHHSIITGLPLKLNKAANYPRQMELQSLLGSDFRSKDS
jgi:hypothetical protein